VEWGVSLEHAPTTRAGRRPWVGIVGAPVVRGDDAGARALARDYLDRYPAGLRRIEAERLAR
jgi:hypothetical protein